LWILVGGKSSTAAPHNDTFVRAYEVFLKVASLDRIDYLILDTLQANGRQSITRTAETVHISLSACWQRVKRLEKSGIIQRYTAEIALEKLQVVQIVMAHIALSKHNRKAYELFERSVLEIPEVVECYELTGQFDFHLKFIVTSMERYKAILENIISHQSGVEKYFTYVVTRVAKNERMPHIRDLRR
jgi:DNA-binding Lrp family transcriptional regulator